MPMEELEALYRRYGLIVERRCARLLGHPTDARDAAQETFARAAARLVSFRAEGERLAWLYRISTHVCFNLRRDRKRRDPVWLEAVRASRDWTVDEEQRAQAREEVLRLLDGIGDRLTRELVVAVYIDEMHQGEAAELLRISRQTANAKLRRFVERSRALRGES